MARRFGGHYSPGRTPRDGDAAGRAEKAPAARRSGGFAGRQPDTYSARPNFLFLTALPLLFTAFSQGALGMAADFAAFGVLILAFWLLREGLRAEAAYVRRPVARRPAIPRKTFALVLTAAGAALAAWRPGEGLGAPLIYGALAGVLHGAAFGFDPMRDKGAATAAERAERDRMEAKLGQARATLRAIETAAAGLGDREIALRVAGFGDAAQAMFRQIEKDPRDMRAARRYLGVYLSGALAATEKFAALPSAARTGAARDEYLALLGDLESSFAAQSERLLFDDRSALEVEIEVLRDRLQRDGVSAE